MIYAMFTMVILTFSVALYLFRMRVAAVKSGQLKLSAFRLNDSADIPLAMAQAARNYSNLFEVPVLFYTAGALALALHLNTVAMTILAWLFVAARAAHTWIHLTNNNVIHRLKAFMAGNLCVFLMWCLLVWEYTRQI